MLKLWQKSELCDGNPSVTIRLVKVLIVTEKLWQNFTRYNFVWRKIVTDYLCRKITCDGYCDGQIRFVMEISITMWKKSLGEEVYFRIVTENCEESHHKCRHNFPSQTWHKPPPYNFSSTLWRNSVTILFCDGIQSQIIFATEIRRKIRHNFV